MFASIFLDGDLWSRAPRPLLNLLALENMGILLDSEDQ
jgi:hypothetical protein